eukprot:1062795-Pelagomonas_calceolata.AAC.5
MSYSRMSCGMFHQHVDGQKTIWPPKPHQHCTTQKIIPCICHACQQLGTQSYHLQVGDSLRPGLLNPSPFHVNSLELHDALPSASQQRTLWPWRASHYQGFAMLVTWVVFSAVLCARAAICVLVRDTVASQATLCFRACHDEWEKTENHAVCLL